VTAVTPLIAGDKKLKETVDTVNELLKTPWLQSGTGVAEGLTARVKEAFAQGNRMLPPSYLDTHTDRILLEQRHYQRRTVFGEPWIRSLFAHPGSSQTMPAYLPDAIAKKLPMFQTIRARLIAEAHLQQDQYETHPSALRVVAIGRVASLMTSPRR
jgi:isopentenyldiphosphate isomerase